MSTEYCGGWNEVRGALQRGFRFEDFAEAMVFVNRLAEAAERRTTIRTSRSAGTRLQSAGGRT